MKRLRLLIPISIVIFGMLIWQGCDQAEDALPGYIAFGMEAVEESALKGLDASRYDVDAALVTIIDQYGNLLYEKEFIEFYTWGSSFVTRSLKLVPGEYQLKEFMLVDSTGSVIWATPTEGSRLAELVDDPLPMYFSVRTEQTTHLYPQVVRVSGNSPGDFGYVDFNIEFINWFCLAVNYESECMYIDADSFSVTGDTVVYDNGDFVPWYQSWFILTDAITGEYIMQTELMFGDNKIRMPFGHDEVVISVIDCMGNYCFSELFSMRELKLFNCDTGEKLFIDCAHHFPEVTITPEYVDSITIDQGVFGRITEYWSDTLYTDSAYFEPVSADLYIYDFEFTDSIFYLSNLSDGCYFYPEIYMQPHAIVRSNSQGYYQLPLEYGQYQYMVQTERGFYIDLYLSSRKGGEFYVVKDEVTTININILECLWF